ncbi:hypothetical protein [Virgibacillus sp. SK37]|uniref:hypothetical protein n=1 Tax=Virgibacillus sp. SK37 TaxID=403957 RepID=UPI0004D0B427|nr:hypothetical protein [Virgibacillus sp. SK37]AIF42994.1 hypothetical protein X953_07275 [Virgibacillus sp. SK37]
MENQIITMLTDLDKEMKSMRSEINQEISEMNKRFDAIDAKLDSIVEGFGFTTTSSDFDFLLSKVNELEMEVYKLKKKSL